MSEINNQNEDIENEIDAVTAEQAKEISDSMNQGELNVNLLNDIFDKILDEASKGKYSALITLNDENEKVCEYLRGLGYRTGIIVRYLNEYKFRIWWDKK